MKIQLSDHFTYKRLLRFTLPTISMLVFTSIYSVVDGFFVSNFVGDTPFAALNLIWPFIMMLSAVGFMMGAGGSAVVGKTLGEGKKEKASEYFTAIVITTAILSVALTLVFLPYLEKISLLMGSNEAMLPYCVEYGRILLIGLFTYTVQNMFQGLMIAAGEPRLGFFVNVGAGITNMILDYVFVAVLEWGLAGAAWATVGSQVIGSFVPLIYFLLPNKSLLRLTKPDFAPKTLFKVMTNGSSELVSNISASVVGMVFNLELMKHIGQDGVSAYGVMMYVNFIFFAIFFGYCMGFAPVVSYHYGAENTDEIKNLFRKSLVIIGCMGIGMSVVAFALARPLSAIFVGYDEALLSLTVHGFRVSVASFFFAGFNFFGSSFFTALNNGLVSATISFIRILVFQIASVILMAEVFGVEGIWWSMTVAEVLAIFLTGSFLWAYRGKYKYV